MTANFTIQLNIHVTGLEPLLAAFSANAASSLSAVKPSQTFSPVEEVKQEEPVAAPSKKPRATKAPKPEPVEQVEPVEQEILPPLPETSSQAEIPVEKVREHIRAYVEKVVKDGLKKEDEAKAEVSKYLTEKLKVNLIANIPVDRRQEVIDYFKQLQNAA